MLGCSKCCAGLKESVNPNPRPSCDLADPVHQPLQPGLFLNTAQRDRDSKDLGGQQSTPLVGIAGQQC